MFDQTVRSWLREAGVIPRRPVRCNVFTPRLQWWKQRARQTRTRLRTVLSSDEFRFLPSRDDGRNDELQTTCNKSTDLVVAVSWCWQYHGGGSIMVVAVSWCWQYHGVGSIMVVAVSWWWQYHGGGSIMVVAVSWW